ncbi:unnamed protein product, partial [Mesorhabditis spiculigera]
MKHLQYAVFVIFCVELAPELVVDGYGVVGAVELPGMVEVDAEMPALFENSEFLPVSDSVGWVLGRGAVVEADCAALVGSGVKVMLCGVEESGLELGHVDEFELVTVGVDPEEGWVPSEADEAVAGLLFGGSEVDVLDVVPALDDGAPLEGPGDVEAELPDVVRIVLEPTTGEFVGLDVEGWRSVGIGLKDAGDMLEAPIDVDIAVPEVGATVLNELVGGVVSPGVVDWVVVPGVVIVLAELEAMLGVVELGRVQPAVVGLSDRCVVELLLAGATVDVTRG